MGFSKIPVVPDDTNTNISGNSYLFCRLAEAEALLVGDDSNIGFGSTCSAAIDKVSTDFGDASAPPVPPSTTGINQAQLSFEMIVSKVT